MRAVAQYADNRVRHHIRQARQREDDTDHCQIKTKSARIKRGNVNGNRQANHGHRHDELAEAQNLPFAQPLPGQRSRIHRHVLPDASWLVNRLYEFRLSKGN